MSVWIPTLLYAPGAHIKDKAGAKARESEMQAWFHYWTQVSLPAESNRGQYVGVCKGRLRISSEGGGEGGLCASLPSRPCHMVRYSTELYLQKQIPR